MLRAAARDVGISGMAGVRIFANGNRDLLLHLGEPPEPLLYSPVPLRHASHLSAGQPAVRSVGPEKRKVGGSTPPLATTAQWPYAVPDSGREAYGRAVARPWKCRLGMHTFVRRSNSGDPNDQICIRCRKERTFIKTGGLFARFGPLG
jgi:hypothetical protein